MGRKVFYVANTQADNLGDLVINTLLLRQLSKRSEITINVRHCADNYRNMLATVDGMLVNEGYFAFIKRLLWCSLKGEEVDFFLKPGHFHGEDGGLVKKAAVLVCYGLMKLSGVRICRVGASVGPFSPMIERLERWQSRFFHAYTVREAVSLGYAKKIGIERVSYCPDMAFLMEGERGGKAEDRSGRVVYSFREKTLSDDGEELSLLPVLSRALAFFNPDELLFVSQVASDEGYNSQLAENLGVRSDQVVFDDGDGGDILECYRHAEYVLSNRLHVLLFAAMQGAVPIAVVDRKRHGKITGVFESLGVEELLHDINSDLDILDHVSQIDKRKGAVIKRLESAFSEQRLAIIDVLKSLGHA